MIVNVYGVRSAKSATNTIKTANVAKNAEKTNASATAMMNKDKFYHINKIELDFIFYLLSSQTKMPVKVSYAYSIGVHFICEEDTRLFSSVKQRDMCLRLHKTKCQQCREHAWVECKRESRINANKDPQKHKVMDEIKDAHKLGY
jgi:hypothetical protein